MLVSTKMITGFNTDVRHEEHVYHVQTEDGGSENPILESLIYVGGTIVAKKLTPYSEQLDEGADQEAIASLLRRQHQIIIAAIKAGRIDDLIRHTRKQQAGNEAQEKRPSYKREDAQPDRLSDSPKKVRASDAVAAPVSPAVIATSKPDRPSARISGGQKVNAPASTARGDTGVLNFDQVIADYVKRGSDQARLDVRVLTPEVFIAGRSIGLRVQVMHDSKPNLDATVTVKIIGTAFKPQVFIGRVGRDGVANFSLALPAFTAGTAAIVIEAQSAAGRGELKNLIRRA
ncbi:MAG: hypothetical protein AABN33_20240 [Acidobacteriota bacterium]